MVDGQPVVVGISTHAVRARWDVWDTDTALIQAAYPRVIAAVGGLPVLLPPIPGVIADMVPRLDALVLSGGPDVDPVLYGQEPHARIVRAPADRDKAELELLAAAQERGLPVLGVCRGMQLLNVFRGGSLLQHLPDVVGHTAHAPVPGPFGTHPIRVHPHSRLAQVIGRQEVTGVPTYHHQGIDELGEGLVATAWTHDGTVEALEDPSMPFCLGVQWHPEAADDPALFAGLVEAARELRVQGPARPAGRRAQRSERSGRRAAAARAAAPSSVVPPPKVVRAPAASASSPVEPAAVAAGSGRRIDLTSFDRSAAQVPVLR